MEKEQVLDCCSNTEISEIAEEKEIVLNHILEDSKKNPMNYVNEWSVPGGGE